MFNYHYYAKKLSGFTNEMGLVFPAPGTELLPVKITPLEMLASEAQFHCFMFWKESSLSDPVYADLCIMASRAIDMAVDEDETALAAALDMCFSTVYELGVPLVKKKRKSR